MKEEMKKLEQTNQVIMLLFIISIVVSIILVVYTVINIKAVDKLTQRVEAIETNTYGSNGGNNGEPAEQASSYDTSSFKTIMPSDIKKESKNETIVVLWARQSCGYCVAYAPIITEVAKEHNVTLRYINMESIVDMATWNPSNEKEYSILENLEGTGEFKDFAKEAIEGTPGTFFIKNNKIIYGIIGYVEKATVEEAFKKVGL